MPRKKVAAQIEENEDSSQVSDSQNTEIEFNIQDLEYAEGQELVNVLKEAVKYVERIYHTPEKLVEDDLVEKIVLLSSKESYSKEADRYLTLCLAMIMSLNNKMIDFEKVLSLIIQHLNVFDNDKKNLKLFNDLIEYLTTATTQVEVIALKTLPDYENSIIKPYIENLYSFMQSRVSDNDKRKISNLLMNIFSKLYMLNDQLLIFVLSRYYEQIKLQGKSEMLKYINNIMEGIIKEHKQILIDVVISVYNGKMELELYDDGNEIEEEEEEEKDDDDEEEEEEEEKEMEEDDDEEDDDDNDVLVMNKKNNIKKDDISNKETQIKHFKEAEKLITEIDIILKLVEISEDFGKSILPQLELVSNSTKERLHELITITKIITLCPTLESSQENKLNRFYTDLNEEVRIIMSSQCTLIILDNNDKLKDEVKSCCNGRLNDTSPTVRKIAFENLCTTCVMYPNLFTENEISNMCIRMIDKEIELKKMAISGLSNIYKGTVTKTIIQHNTFQISSLKKEYNKIKRFLVIPNEMVKLYICNDVIDVLLRSIQENILPPDKSSSVRAKILIATFIEMEEENRNMFMKLIKRKISAKKLLIDFMNERKTRLSEMTLAKCRSSFNLTITQIRKLEKSNNKKLNEMLNNLLSNDISYKDAYRSFMELLKDKTWGNECYVIVYTLIAQFIVNKEIIECIFNEILSSEEILQKNYDIILSFLYDISCMDANIFPVSCIELLFEFVEDSKDSKRINMVLKLLSNIIQSNNDIDKSNIKEYKERLMQFTQSTEYKDKSLIKYSSILLLHPPFLTKDDNFVKELLDVNALSYDNPNLESHLISLRMLIKYQCKYFTDKDRCKSIIKAMNEKLLKYEETEKPGRSIRRSVIIKSLILKVYGMFLWRYEGGDLVDYTIYFENILSYLYKVMRYEGNLLKNQDILSQNEKNLLLYTAIFQTIKAARRLQIAEYIEVKTDLLQDLCFFIKHEDEDFQWKYLEKVRYSISKYNLHYPFFVIFALAANEDKKFAAKAYEYFNESVIQQRIRYDRTYSEASQIKEDNIIIQNSYNDLERYRNLVEYCIIYLLHVIANYRKLDAEPKQSNYDEQQNYIHMCLDVIVDKNGDNKDFIAKILDRMLYCKDKKDPDNKYLAIFTSMAIKMFDKKTANYAGRPYDGPVYLPNTLFIRTNNKIDCVVDIEVKNFRTPRKSSTPGSVYKSRINSSIKELNKASNSTSTTPVSSVKSKELLSTSSSSTTKGRKTNSVKQFKPRKIDFDKVEEDEKSKKNNKVVEEEEEEDDDDDELPSLYPEDEGSDDEETMEQSKPKKNTSKKAEKKNECVKKRDVNKRQSKQKKTQQSEEDDDDKEENEEEEAEIAESKPKKSSHRKSVKENEEKGKKETQKKDYKIKRGLKRQKIEELSDNEEEEDNEDNDEDLNEETKPTPRISKPKQSPVKQKKITSFTPSKRKGRELMDDEEEDDDDVIVPMKRKITEVKSTPKSKKSSPKKTVTPTPSKRKLYSDKKDNTKISSYRVSRVKKTKK